MMNEYNYIKGVFLQELKNRFLCLVLVDNKPIECYVPSSCHLSNFLEMDNRKVLLKINPEKSRTKYSLVATEYKDYYIILNTSFANTLILENINKRTFSFLGKRKKIIRESKINTYKSDLYIQDTNTLIEIKSLISESKIGIFPTVYSERTLQQFKIFKSLLKNNYKICIFIVSLSPTVNSIVIDKKSDFYSELIDCIKSGLKIYGFRATMYNDFRIILKKIKMKY